MSRYSEIPQGPPVPKTMGSHSRSFSYEQMQQMGLSKAIDEYHRLLETGAQINTPRIAGYNLSGSSSYVSSILKATVIRPLPTIARPETVIACIGALWSIVSFLIYSTAPITIPFLVWLAFAPATPLQIPAWLTNTYPALKSTNLQPPADLSVRVAAIIVALVALRAAEAAVSARALRRQQASENAITPERLEACYSGRPMAGASASSVDASSQKWQLVIQEVVVLSKQYEDAPMPVCTRADALAWLERVAKEVGFTLPREAYHGAESAMKAVEQVRKMLVA